MGKKRSRDSQTSKGERRNVSKATTKLVRRTKSVLQTSMDKAEAAAKGKKTKPLGDVVIEYRNKFLDG